MSEAAARASDRRAVPPWFGAWLLALVLRLPIVALPGLGRDEAAYLYWASHPEPSYSPLIQLLLWPTRHLEAAWAHRGPMLAVGLLVLLLFDRLLAGRGANAGARWFGCLALSLTPWQTLVGCVLHPDDLLLAATLGLTLALRAGRVVTAALVLGLAVWAKLSGLLLVPVAFLALILTREASPLRRAVALAIACGVIAPVLLELRAPLWHELFRFGRIAGASPFRGPIIWGGSVLFQAGVILPIAAVFGAQAALRSARNRRDDPARARDALVTLGLAASFVFVFGAAALFNQQWKENWMFPALVLLFPASLPFRAVRRVALVASAAASLLVTIAMTHPQSIAWAEDSLPGGYATKAGEREAQVSAASRWSERLGEYRPLESFAREIDATCAARGLARPTRVVSDDYGLACQLATAWPQTEVILPRDGIFWRTVPAQAEGEYLLLAVNCEASELWADLASTEPLATLPHPYAARTVALALGQSVSLHAPFTQLLSRYVVGDKVRYAAWKANADDLRALSTYVDALEAARPSSFEPKAGLAYWINLYNAATLELVLGRYPVASIKDIGSTFKSPWKKKVVKVEGRELSLDEIENEIVRPTFKDARVHFALNCASLGCPPIRGAAYEPDSLDSELDQNCRRALADARWFSLEGNRARLTKIFDWYGGDFEAWAGGVRAFVAKYGPSVSARSIEDAKISIEFMDYDWALNRAE